MYNHVMARRSGTAWQPVSKLQLRHSELGYDATVWGEDAPKDFADAPYPENPDGFSADTYTSVTQTLTEQARVSLALLQEQEAQAVFNNPITPPKTSASVNEHLPFVMDDYAAARRIKVLLAKGLLDKTSKGRFVDDLATAKAQFKLDKQELKTAPSPLEDVEEAVDTSAHEVPDDIVQAHETPAELPSQEDTNVLSLEEVEQREQTQYAKGHEEGIKEGQAQGFEQGRLQGIEEGKLQGIEEGKALGFEEGKAQGIEEGKGQGLEEAIQEALEKGKAQGIEEGLAQGIAQGERQTREAMEQEVATQCEVLSQVAEGLHDLLQDPQRFFNPLKRLAMHMAQQIARHELSTSPQAIDALVQNCLNELDHPIKGAVIVELNPQDKKLLETLTSASLQGVHLESVSQLRSGSVRVIANDMVVEDLIENRLEALSRSLEIKEAAGNSDPVQASDSNEEASVEEKLPDANGDGEVEDVHS
jgi:flagellar biosynthesis/type III secretory pathway protein FliH